MRFDRFRSHDSTDANAAIQNPMSQRARVKSGGGLLILVIETETCLREQENSKAKKSKVNAKLGEV